MFSPADNATPTHARHDPRCDPGTRSEVKVDEVPDAVEDGEHYIGIREHSDLWRGRLEVDGVPSLVRPSSFHVCFYSSGVTGCHKSSSRRPREEQNRSVSQGILSY